MNASSVLTHLARAHHVVLEKEQDEMQTHERRLQEEHKRALSTQARRELARAAQERRELTRTLELREQQAHIVELKEDVQFLTQRVESLRATLSPEQLRGVEQLIVRVHKKIKEKEKKMEKT